MSAVEAIHVVSCATSTDASSEVRNLIPSDMHVARLHEVLSALRPAPTSGARKPLISVADVLGEDGYNERDPVDILEVLELIGVMLPEGAVYKPPSDTGEILIPSFESGQEYKDVHM